MLREVFYILIVMGAILAGCGKAVSPSFQLRDDCGAMRTGGMDECRFEALRPKGRAGNIVWEVVVKDTRGKICADCLDVEADGDSLTLRATQKPCAARVTARFGGRAFSRDARVAQNTADADADGFPDVVELTDAEDRASFRAWFTAVAASQLEAVSEWWRPENRDCAGLVRFAFREALRAHTGETAPRYTRLQKPPLRDVAKYHYPDVPLLSTRVFRTAGGAFRASDVAGGKFSDFAESRILQEHNTVRVSRNIRDALPGDLLFFFHTDDPDMPYHAMIVLGPEGKADPLLLYHTGPVRGTKGRLKCVPVSALLDWPDARWWPAPENENFLGVYRFRILD